MPNHDELVSLASAVADYFRQLEGEQLPPELIAELTARLHDQLVWHDLLGHECAREPWEDE